MHFLIPTASFAAPVYAPDVGELVQAVTVVTGTQALVNRTEFLSASLDGYHTDRSVEPNMYLTTTGVTASYNFAAVTSQMTLEGDQVTLTYDNRNVPGHHTFGGLVMESGGPVYVTLTGSAGRTSALKLSPFTTNDCTSLEYDSHGTGYAAVQLGFTGSTMTYADQLGSSTTLVETGRSIDLSVNLDPSVLGTAFKSGLSVDTSFVPVTAIYGKDVAGTVVGQLNALAGQANASATSGSAHSNFSANAAGSQYATTTVTDGVQTSVVSVTPTYTRVDGLVPGMVSLTLTAGTMTLTTHAQVIQLAGSLSGDVTINVANFQVGQTWFIDTTFVTYNGHQIVFQPLGHGGATIITFTSTQCAWMYCSNPGPEFLGKLF